MRNCAPLLLFVMSFDAARVQKELVEIDRDKASGVSVEIMGDNLAHLTGFVKGARTDWETLTTRGHVERVLARCLYKCCGLPAAG